MGQMNLSLSDEELEQMKAIQKACDVNGMIMSKFVYNGTMHYFNTGKWGELFGNKEEEIVTTADIVHDSMQDTLTGDEKWIRL
jgi:muramoyltetrapeptide carboxypeptidase LdcA involved in peptidoglycan recycling